MTVALSRPQLVRAETAIAAVRLLPPLAALAREMRRIRRSEIYGSTTLAGSRLSAEDVDALLDLGRAQGNHRFADYVLARAYAAAADWVSDNRSHRAGDARLLITVDELRQLNARATTGSGVRGGGWRLSNPLPQAGIVAPAAWLVAREATALIDRYGRGPHEGPIALWLAKFLGRFARLRPFEAANGRTARLAANLMLRRLDIVPIVLGRRDRTRFRPALAACEANQPDSLAALLAAAIVRTCNQMSAAAPPNTAALEPLRILAGNDYTALAKAAQRGRLRTIVRGGRYFTTSDWVAEYRATRRSARAAPTAHPGP